MNKRGVVETPLRSAIVFVLIIMVLLGLMTGVYRKTSTTVFSNEFLAKDLALTIESLIAAEGNVVLDYSQDLTNKTVEISDGKVSVYEKGKEVSRVTAKYVESGRVDVNDVVLKPRDGILKVRFLKQGDQISVTDDMQKKISFAITCPLLSAKDKSLDDTEALIDLAHRKDDDDLGFVSVDAAEAEIVDKIGVYLKSLKSEIPNLRFTRDTGVAIAGERDEKIRDTTDVIISLNAGSYSASFNEVRAYINPESSSVRESGRLACLILKKMQEDNEIGSSITSVRVLPAEESSPGFGMLDNDKIAVSLEIGNIQSSKGREMLSKASEIGRSIHRGMAEYYKS